MVILGPVKKHGDKICQMYVAAGLVWIMVSSLDFLYLEKWAYIVFVFSVFSVSLLSIDFYFINNNMIFFPLLSQTSSHFTLYLYRH